MDPLELIPFDPEPGDLKVTAFAERQESLWTIEYRLGGSQVDELVIPAASGSPARKDDLWAHTCLEAFFAEAGQPWYWELNLSPSLDWQAYHFRDYRAGRKLESRIGRIEGEAFRLPQGGHGFRLRVETAGLFSGRASVELGISAVLERADGRQGFWALAHAGKKPDFHLRKSFVVRL